MSRTDNQFIRTIYPCFSLVFGYFFFESFWLDILPKSLKLINVYENNAPSFAATKDFLVFVYVYVHSDDRKEKKKVGDCRLLDFRLC